MFSNLKSIVSSKFTKQIVGVVIAILFLWLAFRGSNLVKLWNYVKAVNIFYLMVIFVSGLLSHFLRAVRWVFLLAPLSKQKISLWNSFCAVIYGYAVNVVIPRGGEVVRLITISKEEQLPWVGVLSTMFIDRLLDLALLVLLIGATLSILPNQAFANVQWLVPGGIALSITSILGLLLLPQMAAIINWVISRPWLSQHLSEKVTKKITDLISQFDTGCQSLKNPVVYPAIGVLSIAIWVLYWFNFYLMILAFGLSNQVNLKQGFIVFTIGSVGVLVPTPGNVGSFHFLVSQALNIIAGINQELSLAYASLLHIMCTLVIPCVPAAICFVVQAYTLRNNKTKSV